MKIRHAIKVLFLITVLQGCAANVYNWSEIPENLDNPLLTSNEKVEYYNKYAIDKLSIYYFGGHGIGFSTLSSPDKVYDLYTYSPILTEIAPETQEFFSEAMFWEKMEFLGTAGLLAVDIFAVWGAIQLNSSFAGSDSSSISNSDSSYQNLLTYSLLTLGGLILTGGFALFSYSKELEQYEKIKSTYNTSLLNLLKLKAPLSLEHQLPIPSLTFTETQTPSLLSDL